MFMNIKAKWYKRLLKLAGVCPLAAEDPDQKDTLQERKIWLFFARNNLTLASQSWDTQPTLKLAKLAS